MKSKQYTRKLFEYLDRYYVADLNTMINEVPGRPSGGLGYPAIHAIITGMELLGRLMTDLRDESAFSAFWNRYFPEINPRYKNEHLKKVFRENIRNGTAHIFLVKSGIVIDKGGRNHLSITERGELHINLKVLLNDFFKAYGKLKEEIELGNEDLYKGIDNIKYDQEVALKQVEAYINSLKNNKKDPKISYTAPSNSATVSASIFTGTRPYNPDEK